MVKLRKVRTESPATTLGVLAFRLDTEAPKIHPRDFLIVLGLFIIIEVLLNIFLPL